MNAAEAYAEIQSSLNDFLLSIGYSDPTGDIEIEKQRLYTETLSYLKWTAEWHEAQPAQAFLDIVASYASPTTTIIDVGSASGISGLTLALIAGCPVSFHDFDGVGFQFITYFASRHPSLAIHLYPYGAPLPHHDIAICADTLEHTGNHLGALRWLASMADRVALCYPIPNPFEPPYVQVIDEWVDDHAIMAIIHARYDVLWSCVGSEGRRYAIYDTPQIQTQTEPAEEHTP